MTSAFLTRSTRLLALAALAGLASLPAAAALEPDVLNTHTQHEGGVGGETVS